MLFRRIAWNLQTLVGYVCTAVIEELAKRHEISRIKKGSETTTDRMGVNPLVLLIAEIQLLVFF